MNEKHSFERIKFSKLKVLKMKRELVEHAVEGRCGPENFVFEISHNA